MKLVLVTPYFSTHGGGVEAVAGRIAQGLVEHHGYAIEWFASDCDPLPSQPSERLLLRPMRCWNGIEQSSGLPYPFWNFSACAQLVDAIRNADVVHIHEFAYLSSLLALGIAKMYKVPVLLTQHTGAVRGLGLLIGPLYRAFAILVARLAFRASRHVTFVSMSSRNHYASLLPSYDRVSTIFNGVEFEDQAIGSVIRTPSEIAAERNAIRASLGLPPVGHCAVVLFVGRLIEKKGIGVVRKVASALPSVRFLVAGRSSQKPINWGTSQVEELGYVPSTRLRQIYRAADLLLLPSYSEGFPLVVQEALVEGCPVLSTDEVAAACPQAAKLITACQVPECDDPTPWLKALVPLLAAAESPQARACRAQEARELWSWMRCTAAYSTLLATQILHHSGEDSDRAVTKY